MDACGSPRERCCVLEVLDLFETIAAEALGRKVEFKLECRVEDSFTAIRRQRVSLKVPEQSLNSGCLRSLG